VPFDLVGVQALQVVLAICIQSCQASQRLKYYFFELVVTALILAESSMIKLMMVLWTAALVPAVVGAGSGDTVGDGCLPGTSKAALRILFTTSFLPRLIS
jgi:hypothetical protein